MDIRKFALLMLLLFCTAVFAQDLPRIAVYVTGDVPENEKAALGTRMLSSLVGSGRYIAIERSTAFLAEIEREHAMQRSGAIDDSQIRELGKQFGVKYICIAAITPAFGSYQVSARIVDVETAVVITMGESASPLKTMDDLAEVSDRVVGAMFGDGAVPADQPDPAVWPPRAAVYITGVNMLISGALNKAVGSALMKSGIYEGITPIDKYVSGTPSTAKLVSAGKEAGVHYIFVINAAGKKTVAIVDVDLAMEVAKISLDGDLSSPLDAATMALSIVNFIMKAGPKPPPGYVKPDNAAEGGKRQRNDGRWGNIIPPLEAGKGEVKLGFTYADNDWYTATGLFLGTRYSITNGLEMSLILPIPLSLEFGGWGKADDYAGLGADPYATGKRPTLGLRYHLPVGLGFFADAFLPIDTRDRYEPEFDMDLGIQYCAFGKALAFGAELGLALPFAENEDFGMYLGIEIGYSLGIVTPYINFGMGNLLMDADMIIDLGIGCGITGERWGLDMSLGFGLAAEYITFTINTSLSYKF